MFNPENLWFSPQPFTDNRRDFEVNVGGDEFIVSKLPALSTVNIAKKDLKKALKNN